VDDGRHVGEGLIAGYEGIKDLKVIRKIPQSNIFFRNALFW